MLSALEEEAYDQLPGGLFNVSFVRQYARAVDLDEEEAVKKLKAATSVEVALPYSDSYSDKSPLLMQSAASRFGSALWGVVDEYSTAVAGFVVASLLIGVGVVWYNRSAAPLATAEADTGVRPAIEEVVYQQPVRRQAPIRLEMRITDTVWIRAVADGKRVVDRILHAGETQPIEAESQVRLNIGNAGGLTLALNGETLPAFGGRGQVRRLMITPDGLTVLGGTGLSKPAESTTRETASIVPERTLATADR